MEQRIIRQMVDSASRFVGDVQWQMAFRRLQMAPADSGLSSSAQLLLNTLYYLQGKGVISGNMIIWKVQMSSWRSLKIAAGNMLRCMATSWAQSIISHRL